MTRNRGSYAPVNDEEAIDALLARWARDRDVYVPAGAALAAAEAALAEVRHDHSPLRFWKPAAVFGGSVAAALTGVLLLGPGPAAVADGTLSSPAAVEMATADPSTDPAAFAPQDVQLAAVEAGDTAQARPVGSDAGLAAIADDFPALDNIEDDILMTSHVFTLRPDEEPIY